MVLWAEHGARELAGQMRFFRPCRRRRQPLDRQAELLLKFQMMRQRGLIVRRQRQNERAFAAQFDVDAGRLQKLLGEGRPARLAIAAERDQRLFARLGFSAGGKHPGRGMARARPGFAAVEQQNLGARRQAPGDAKADHACADNDDARALPDRRMDCLRSDQRGSLRWNDPDRFDGFDLSRAPCAAPLADR